MTIYTIKVYTFEKGVEMIYSDSYKPKPLDAEIERLCDRYGVPYYLIETSLSEYPQLYLALIEAEQYNLVVSGVKNIDEAQQIVHQREKEMLTVVLPGFGCSTHTYLIPKIESFEAFHEKMSHMEYGRCNIGASSAAPYIAALLEQRRNKLKKHYSEYNIKREALMRNHPLKKMKWQE